MIDKDTLESERMKLQSDFEAVQEQIRNTEGTLNSLRNNLNALRPTFVPLIHDHIVLGI